MYYLDILELLKTHQEKLSSTELYQIYLAKIGEANRNNFNKALSKLRRRDDVEFEQHGRIFFYMYVGKD